MEVQEKKTPMVVHCGECAHEWVSVWLPMETMKAARAMKAPCPMCGSKKVIVGATVKPTNEGDPVAWLANGDTGLSSKTIWSVLMDKPVDHASIPSDPSDFGRCYRLLKVMPSWRARLLEVATAYPEWKPLVDAWDELTALYEQELPSGTCPKLYARMQVLRGEEPMAGPRWSIRRRTR